MDIKKTIKELREMQNPMEDYAGMIGAPAFAYCHRYVFPELEDYIIQDAIDLLKEVEKYRWHDLRENPDDLPEEDINYGDSFSDNVLVLRENEDIPEVAYINLSTREWFNTLNEDEGDVYDIIMWKYIEMPEEKSVSKKG